MNKVVLANIAAAISALSAGLSIVATRFIINETDPISLAFFRYFIATIFLLPILYLGLRKQRVPFCAQVKVSGHQGSLLDVQRGFRQ